MTESLFSRAKKRWQDYKTIRDSPLFDSAYYRSQAGLPKGRNAAWEYLDKWHVHQQSPSPFFDQAHYLNANADVRAEGLNPLLHYLQHGFVEHRSPLANFDVAGFYAAHPELNGRNVEPIDYCLDRYGLPHWDKLRARWMFRDADDYARADLKAARALFDADYYRSMYGKRSKDMGDPFLHYLRAGAQSDRNPYAGFDGSFYQRTNMRPGVDADVPLVHYVRQGQDAGCQTAEDGFRVFEGAAPVPARTPRVLVHAHLYYPQIIAEFLPGFAHFPSDTRFVLTTCRAADAGHIRALIAKSELEIDCEVRVVSNRGRDILPFLKVLHAKRGEVDVALHVHSKVSPHIAWGTDWRQYLIEMTMGSAEIVDHVLAAFADPEANLGCLYPENFYRIKTFLTEEHNNDMLAGLMHQYGVAPHPDDARFPASSFAWYRMEALAPLLDHGYTDADFEDETGKVDGTLAHAFERFLPMVVRDRGFDAVPYTAPRRPDLGFDRIDLPQPEPTAAEATDVWVRDTPAAARHGLAPLDPLYTLYNGSQLDIHWVIPSFAQGAGGHMTIFRIVHFLESFGHNQTIWLQNPFNHPDQQTARTRISDWYQPIGDRVAVRFLPKDVSAITGDVVIATDAWTAFPVAQMTNFLERFYFIQDVESMFHPTGENQLTIDATYRFGFAALTAGPWLKTFAAGHGMWVRDWPLCADLTVYKPALEAPAQSAKTQDETIKIAFYARAYTPRRAVRLGFAAFEELAKRGVDFHVSLFGEENLTDTGDFPQTQLGILSPRELAALYNDSDIGVVFSTTNYSLLPLEMAACGLPVVDLDVPSMRAVFTPDEVALADPTPQGVADAVEALIKDPERRARQREAALARAHEHNWQDSARLVEAGIKERLAERGHTDLGPKIAEQLGSPALSQPARASVLIPTYNAGTDFEAVLDQVCAQKLDVPYDVIIIDSASSDGTPERIKARAKSPGLAKEVRLIPIEQKDFQHGATRNRGIAESGGSHVAILTQDARPANEAWLAQLLSGFAQGDRVAGAIGRHRAYPEHGAFTHRDMKNHFDGLQALGNCLTRSEGLPSLYYPMSTAWQMLLYFYSDNNSAIAKAAWELCPYPNIDWGEDYVWARKMMNLGWQKAYVHSAEVFHSHDFEGKSTYSAARAEGRFWKEHFGFDLHGDPQADIDMLIARDTAYARKNRVSEEALATQRKAIKTLIAGRLEGAEGVPRKTRDAKAKTKSKADAGKA